jgi:phosphoribosylformylglycinamidine synthase PurS subunit
MKRRDVLKLLAGAGVVTLLPWSRQALAQQAEPWQGKLLLSVNVRRGMDQSSWADPRSSNVINHYGEAGQAGNLFFAPLSENEAFFNKYYKQMLVINGMDTGSGSHVFAGLSQKTGQKAVGFPSLPALYAAINGKGLPLPWISMGRRTGGATGGIQTPTLIGGSLGFEGYGNVRQGKYFELDIEATDKPAAQEKAKKMCEKLLANTVIENYEIEIV